MNKTTVILAMALLFPASVALARGDFGRAGGGWGGGDRGSSGWTGGDRAAAGANQGTDNGGGSGWDARSANNDHFARRPAPDIRSGGRPSSVAPERSFGRLDRGSNAPGRFNAYQSNSRFNGIQANHSYSPSFRGAHASVQPLRPRSMGVTRIPRPLASKALLPDRFRKASFRLPTRGPSGGRLSASVVSPRYMNSSLVVNRMASISRSPAFSAKITAFNRAEATAGHYYWHTWNGSPYVHYYDYDGCNWYGWYIGDQCFWLQYYADNWWWYDDWDNRWCYWWGGNWWWPDPWTSVVYVYRDGNYVPAGDSTQTTAGGERRFRSQDGNLLVKVTPQGDAFLYDGQGTAAPVYLDSNVTDVKFSDKGRGGDKVLLILKDGSFEIFNGDGSRGGDFQG